MSLTIVNRTPIFAAIDAERDRQDRLHPGTTRIPDGTGGKLFGALEATARARFEVARANGRLTHADVFFEEAAEVLAETDPDRLRVEIIQAAAVLVKWAEELWRRKGGAA